MLGVLLQSRGRRAPTADDVVAVVAGGRSRDRHRGTHRRGRGVGVETVENVGDLVLSTAFGGEVNGGGTHRGHGAVLGGSAGGTCS